MEKLNKLHNLVSNEKQYLLLIFEKLCSDLDNYRQNILDIKAIKFNQ